MTDHTERDHEAWIPSIHPIAEEFDTPAQLAEFDQGMALFDSLLRDAAQLQVVARAEMAEAEVLAKALFDRIESLDAKTMANLLSAALNTAVVLTMSRGGVL